MELPMLHDHSRNRTYDAVLAGRYGNIRMFEMGKNKLHDGSFAGSGNDHYVVPAAAQQPGQPASLTDGQTSGWVNVQTDQRLGWLADGRADLRTCGRAFNTLQPRQHIFWQVCAAWTPQGSWVIQ